MEVLLVLLIVALLNGAIAYINSLLTGIVPLTLYAEKYMITVSGTNIADTLFNILFGFGVSLIVLKFLKKGFETYVLWSDGDADEEPLSLLTNFFKALAVAICFPNLVPMDGRYCGRHDEQATDGGGRGYGLRLAGMGEWYFLYGTCDGYLRANLYHLLFYAVFPIFDAGTGDFYPAGRYSSCLCRLARQ